MRKFFRCKSCLFPSTKPDLHFDDDGTCGACKYTKYYNNIDWEKRKKSAYDIKLAVTIENHTNEIHAKTDENINLEEATKKISIYLKPTLNEKQYIAFRMLFVENHSEEKVAQFLGYKTTEKKRSAGYKQIKNLKKIFQEKVKQILNERDIL